jgi:predicted SAM-dependent methyltransferase
MKLRNRSVANNREQELLDRRLLNIGCGRHYDRRWVNLDLESKDPSVQIHNVTEGVPFSDSEFDVVYHSHVLEHLKPELGEELIVECFRVLKPGGILRIVVPDLERIAQLYLTTHERAWLNEQEAQTDFDWMKLELLDQLVREHSGGRMGRYMASQEIKNSEFVRWRVGNEYEICRGLDSKSPPADGPNAWITRIARSTHNFRETIARQAVRWLLGRQAEAALDEGLFRSKGEIHRWMYDRYSLRRLCLSKGFVDFRVCTANESRIEEFESFQLDTVGDQVRKPDSLFVECLKPATQSAHELE